MASLAPSAEDGSSGLIRIEGKLCILAGAKPSAFPPANQRVPGAATPAFDGDVQAFVEAGNDESQLYNLAKKCGQCGKVCAVSMAACNGCGATLTGVVESRTNNIFMGFIHGVARGPFPFKVSLRLETTSVMVFDDPLAMTRLHVCAVPTDKYVPDMRTLFANPAAGLALLRRLDDASWQAARRSFLADGPFTAKALGASATGRAALLSCGDGGEAGVEALRQHVVAGLNCPPSQYQLHLQYMLPPLTPFHYGLYRKGAHYTAGRFFPLAYLYMALRALTADPRDRPNGGGVPGCADMECGELVAEVKRLVGVDYGEAHAAEYARVEAGHRLLAAFDSSDFTHALPVDGGDPIPLSPPGDAGAPGRKQLEDGDKLTLQSYGRPYDAAGRPSGVFYSHTRPAPLPTVTPE